MTPIRDYANSVQSFYRQNAEDDDVADYRSLLQGRTSSGFGSPISVNQRIVQDRSRDYRRKNTEKKRRLSKKRLFYYNVSVEKRGTGHYSWHQARHRCQNIGAGERWAQAFLQSLPSFLRAAFLSLLMPLVLGVPRPGIRCSWA